MLKKFVQFLLYLGHLFHFGNVKTVAPCDNHVQLTKGIQPLKRISAGDDHVSTFARLNGAQRIAQTGNFGVALGGGT